MDHWSDLTRSRHLGDCWSMRPPDLNLQEWSKLQDLQRLLDNSTKMHRAMASRLRMLADSLDFFARLKEIYQSPCGTPALESSHTVAMEILPGTVGPKDTMATLASKLKNALTAPATSAARPNAKNSTPSTPKHAKRARTGGRSKARSRLVDLKKINENLQAPTSSATRSKRKRK